MQQTISINLAGLVFHIEKDAFDQLRDYLDEIKGNLRNHEGREEILQDIESRMAEMFQERLSSRKEAITFKDFEAVKSILGGPEAFKTESYREDASENKSSDESARVEESRKGRIHRDIDHKVIGGVCSGIGQYYGFDPLWLRVAFILSFLLPGSGVLVYIVLWIIIPPAKTPDQKKEMRGDRIKVSYGDQTSYKATGNTHQQASSNTFQERRKDFSAQVKMILKTTLDYLETGFVKLGQACKKATTKLEKE